MQFAILVWSRSPFFFDAKFISFLASVATFMNFSANFGTALEMAGYEKERYAKLGLRQEVEFLFSLKVR